MPILIDAYNCVHAGRGMGGAFAELTLWRLCQFLHDGSGSVTLVVDGRPKPDEPSINDFPGITIVYSGTGVAADLVIARIVEKSSARHRITVVSDDRAVVSHARKSGARAQGCEQFLDGLQRRRPGNLDEAAAAQKSGAGLPSGLVEYWLREFGFIEQPRRPRGKKS